MKFITTTTALLFAAVSLATPAPVTGPLTPQTLPEFRYALAGRAAAAVAAIPHLDIRASKPKGGSKGGNGTSSAATSVSPSEALMISALGLGIIEVVRLWT
ncbi:hypothetical protein E8E13_009672 [Curvularia kusanoi]|uniref:Uncharacterized protein n=1 Tax=Curvularia kusanoi TaxID=90978 RepID=A0A9P4TQJ8_CURKU|nr:hypothetical protein E8E13_009672 [Curvularia kusanoi]